MARPKGSKNIIPGKQTKILRVPISLIPIVKEMIKKENLAFKESKKLLIKPKPKQKTKKDLLEIIEKLQMQINLPCEKEKVEA